MKMAAIGFAVMLVVLLGLFVLTGGIQTQGVGGAAPTEAPASSAPSAPSAPAQGGNDPFGSLKIN